jgi:hypothetical protein
LQALDILPRRRDGLTYADGLTAESTRRGQWPAKAASGAGSKRLANVGEDRGGSSAGRRCLPEQHGGERAPPLSEAVRGAVRHHLDFQSPLKADLHHRKAPATSDVRGLPDLTQPPHPGLLALEASGERECATERWSGLRSGGCGGASAGRPPLRAARTPTCCAMGPSPPTSLHELTATRAGEASNLCPPADTTLTPSGTQYGATRCKAEKRKPFRCRGFARPCYPLQRLMDHS